MGVWGVPNTSSCFSVGPEGFQQWWLQLSQRMDGNKRFAKHRKAAMLSRLFAVQAGMVELQT